jgi:hypothetical protein
MIAQPSSYPVHNILAAHGPGQNPCSVSVLVDSIPFAMVPFEQFLDAGYSQSFLNLNSGNGYPTGYYYGGEGTNYFQYNSIYDLYTYGTYPTFWLWYVLPQDQYLWSEGWFYNIEIPEDGVFTDPGESILSLQLQAYTETWAYSNYPLDEGQMIYAENSNYTWAWGMITKFGEP